jgi:hypothetical protein
VGSFQGDNLRAGWGNGTAPGYYRFVAECAIRERNAIMANESQDEQSGCTVDWGWLEGQEIESAWSNLERLELRFKSGLTLKVMAAQWKDQPYLAFDPYKLPESR